MERIRKQPGPREDEPEPDPQIAEQVRVGANRCPYCHTDVDALESAWVACASCLGRHHTACWEEGARCGACGAEERLDRTPPVRGRSLAAAGGATLVLLAILVAGMLVAGAVLRPTAREEAVPYVPPAAVEGTTPARSATGVGADVRNALGRTGAKVSKVYVGTPAHTQGLTTYDVIQSVDGKPVRSVEELSAALSTCEPGQEVKLGVKQRYSDGRVIRVTLVANLDASEQALSDSGQVVFQLLGSEPQVSADPGVKLGEVLVGTAGSDAGLRKHDVIESVNGTPVRGLQDLRQLLAPHRGKTVRLGVARRYEDGRIVELTLPN